MNTLILQCATRYMQPILLLFSVVLLFSGHNEPGGGFCGGLVAASSFALYAIAFSPIESRRLLRVQPQTLIGCGLLLAITSASLSLFLGAPFMTGLWSTVHVPGFGAVHLGTPMFFDIGVYLDVVGVTLLIIYSLAEEDRAYHVEVPAEQEEA